MCGDGEGSHVPAGVSDKEETIFENGTIMEGVVWTDRRLVIRTFVWKIVFIKNDMTGYINFTHCKIKAFISMMVQAITNKNIFFRYEINFVFLIWLKIRPACTTKNFKEMIVRSMTINNFVWGFLIENRSRETIDNISGREKSIFPKLLWKFRM